MFPALPLTGFTFLKLFVFLEFSYLTDFNVRYKMLTAKLLQLGYRYQKLRKLLFFFQNFELVSKCKVGLKHLVLQDLSEPEFYGDLVYEFKGIISRAVFSYLFRMIILRLKRITVKTLNIGTPRPATIVVLNIKQFNFTTK